MANNKKNCNCTADDNCCGQTVTETCTRTIQKGWAKCPTDGHAGMTYIGQRYITAFADPIEWSSDRPYEQNTAVQRNGFTYLSKQPVPVGVDIENSNFWLLWADPNAQMEDLRQTVTTYRNDIDEVENDLNELVNELESSKRLPYSINRANIFTRIETSYASEAVQSVCAFKNGGNDYLAVGISENILTIFSFPEGNFVSAIEDERLKHVNQMCFEANKIYAVPLNENRVITIDVSNPFQPAIDGALTIPVYDVRSFDVYENGTFCLTDANDAGYVKVYDPNTGLVEPLFEMPSPGYLPGVAQTVHYSPQLKMFYMVRGGSNSVIYFNNRGVTNVTNFKPHYQFAALGELEDYIFFDDKIIFCSYAQTGYINTVSLNNVFYTTFTEAIDKPDNLYNPQNGIINVVIDQNSDGLNNDVTTFPGYGAPAMVFKYPQDIEFLLMENSFQSRVAVALSNDCPFVIPVSGEYHFNPAGHKLAGVFMTTGTLRVVSPPNYENWNWVQTDTFDTNKPCMIKTLGGTVIISGGPETPLEDRYYLSAYRSFVYCVPNVANSSAINQCIGSKTLSWL